jgi:hypothetical protein
MDALVAFVITLAVAGVVFAGAVLWAFWRVLRDA